MFDELSTGTILPLPLHPSHFSSFPLLLSYLHPIPSYLSWELS
jgi:hypothetical protein